MIQRLLTCMQLSCYWHGARSWRSTIFRSVL